MKPKEPQRYDNGQPNVGALAIMNPDEKGDWVRYEDAKAWHIEGYHLGVDHGHKEAAPSGLVFQPDGRIEQLQQKPQSTTERLRGARCVLCVYSESTDCDRIFCNESPTPVVKMSSNWCGRFERKEDD